MIRISSNIELLKKIGLPIKWLEFKGSISGEDVNSHEIANTLQSINTNDYLSVDEVAFLTGRSKDWILDARARGSLKTFKKISNRAFYLKDEVIEQVCILVKLYDSFSGTEASTILGMDRHDIKKCLGSLFKDYIIFGKSYYIPKQDVINLKSKLDSSYSIKEIITILNIEDSGTNRKPILKAIDDGRIGESFKFQGQIYIPKQIINNAVKLREETFSISDASKLSGYSKQRIGELCREDAINYCVDIFKLEYRIPKTTINNLRESTEKKDYLNNLNSAGLLEYMLTQLPLNKSPKTISLFKEWVHKTIFRKENDDNYKKDGVRDCVYSLGSLLKFIHTELYMLNDEEVETTIIKNENILIFHKTILSRFLKYVKYEMKGVCVYKEDYYIAFKQKEQSEDEKYSDELWIKYFVDVLDIHKHMSKAIKDYKYASSWLYVLLHFGLGWRKKDVLTMSPVDISIIDIHDFDWFNSNKFTLGNATKLISHMELTIVGRNVSKTRAKRLNFTIAQSAFVPVSLAIVACELHRRTHENERLMHPTFHAYDYQIAQLFQDEELKNFKNRKANKTLLTKVFNKAVMTEGYAHLAYEHTSGVLRRHESKRDPVGYSETMAKHYIISTNSDGSANYVARQLFERTIHGILYDAYTDILFGSTIEDYDKGFSSNTTELISILKNKYKPNELEIIGGTLSLKLDEISQVIREIVNEDIGNGLNPIQRLIKLSEGMMPSMTPYIDCLKGYKNCPYKTSDSCYGCKYSLVQILALQSVAVEVENLMIKLIQTLPYQKSEKIKYSYQLTKLLSIFSEARLAFLRYDETFIDNFINLSSIQATLKKLHSEGKYMLIE